MRSLTDNCKGMVDLGVILMIGITFAALMVCAFIVWTLVDQLGATGDSGRTIANITTGFDDAINLLLVAITILILAIAIGALLFLRGR